MSEDDDADRVRRPPLPDEPAAAEPAGPAPPLVPATPFASVPSPDLTARASAGATPSLSAAGPVHAHGPLDDARRDRPRARTTRLMILGGVLGLLVLLVIAIVLALRA